MQGNKALAGIAALVAAATGGWLAGRATAPGSTPAAPPADAPAASPESVVAPTSPPPVPAHPPETGVSSAAPAAGPSAADRFREAWRDLELEGRITRGVGAFRSIADDAAATRSIRARALVAAARGERLLGHADEAEALLRRAAEEFADVVETAAEARRLQTQVAGAKARWVTGTIALRAGQFLDLDSGGAFASPVLDDGGRAELASRVPAGQERAAFLVRRAEDSSFAAAAGQDGGGTWWRILTDRGRDAWVQTLGSAEVPVIRFVVRTSGTGDVLPAPQNLRCIGSKSDSGPGGIRVRWETEPRYVAWRVERRASPDGPFAELAVVTKPEVDDADVARDVRYGYRVRGVTANGDEGIAAVVQGTVRSRGVVRGSVAIPYTADRGEVDLLAGTLTAGTGDLALEATYGGASGASFRDSSGFRVVGVPGALRDAASPWAVDRDGPVKTQIPPGTPFLVAIRGGGVARCRWSPPSDRGNGVLLEWEADPDADAFRPGGTLEAAPDGDGGIVRAWGLRPGFRVTEIRAAGAAGGSTTLPVTDGVARDPGAADGTVREYSATPIDEDGREGAELRAVLDRRADRATTGTGELHYQQGFSFERSEVVPRDEADIWFESCAGGISSITFSAPGGIATLESAVGRDRSGAPSAPVLLSGVLAAVPGELRLEPSARADSRTPESDVFIVRTRRGGWVRFAIVERVNDRRGWSELPARIEYSWNPRSPRFAEEESGAESIRGWRLAPRSIPVRLEPPAPSLPAGTRDARLRAVATPIDSRGKPGGSVPASGTREEVLVAWSELQDPGVCSFDWTTKRRPAGRAADSGAMDLVYGKTADSFEVRLSSAAGAGSIFDLGPMSWPDVAATPLPDAWIDLAAASFGHVYVLRACEGADGVTALLVVTGLESGERVVFEWIALRGDDVSASAGLDATRAERERLADRLRELAKSSRGGFRGSADTSQARATLAALAGQRIAIAMGDGTLAGDGGGRSGALSVLAVLKSPDGPIRTMIDDTVPRTVRARPFAMRLGNQGDATARQVLECITRAAGACWRVDADGTIRIVPLTER